MLKIKFKKKQEIKKFLKVKFKKPKFILLLKIINTKKNAWIFQKNN